MIFENSANCGPERSSGAQHGPNRFYGGATLCEPAERCGPQIPAALPRPQLPPPRAAYTLSQIGTYGGNDTISASTTKNQSGLVLTGEDGTSNSVNSSETDVSSDSSTGWVNYGVGTSSLSYNDDGPTTGTSAISTVQQTSTAITSATASTSAVTKTGYDGTTTVSGTASQTTSASLSVDSNTSSTTWSYNGTYSISTSSSTSLTTDAVNKDYQSGTYSDTLSPGETQNGNDSGGGTISSSNSVNASQTDTVTSSYDTYSPATSLGTSGSSTYSDQTLNYSSSFSSGTYTEASGATTNNGTYSNYAFNSVTSSASNSASFSSGNGSTTGNFEEHQSNSWEQDDPASGQFGVTAGTAWTSGTYSDTNDSASGSTYDESGKAPGETNYGVVNPVSFPAYAVGLPYAPVPGIPADYTVDTSGHSYEIHQTQSTGSNTADSGSAQVSGGVTTSASGTYNETDTSNSSNKQTDNGSGTYAYSFGNVGTNGTLSTSLVYNSTAGETYTGKTDYSVGQDTDGNLAATSQATITDVKTSDASSKGGTSATTSYTANSNPSSSTYGSTANSSASSNYNQTGTYTIVNGADGESNTKDLAADTKQNTSSSSNYTNQLTTTAFNGSSTSTSTQSGANTVSQTYTASDHAGLSGHSGDSSGTNNNTSSWSQSSSPAFFYDGTDIRNVANTTTGDYTPTGGTLTSATESSIAGTEPYIGVTATSSTTTTAYGGGASPVVFSLPVPAVSAQSGLNSQPVDVLTGLPPGGPSVDTDAPNQTSGAPQPATASTWQNTVINVGVGALTGAITGAFNAAPAALFTGPIYNATFGAAVTDYNNLRATGSSIIGAVGGAILDVAGQLTGVENIASWLEGRDRAGTQLTAFQSWVQLGLGSVNLVLTAVGAVGVGEAALSAASRFGLATPFEVAAKGVVNTGENAVYQSIDAAGNVQYIGITSDLEARAARHLAQKGITIDAIPGLTTLSRFDARAVEQVLIERYGLGNLLNKINSIAESNPIYSAAIARGEEILIFLGL